MVRPEDIVIDRNACEAAFKISHTGKINGTYIGEFKVRCNLTPMQQIQADRDYRELLGTTNPTLARAAITDMAFALAQLKQRIISAPPFWYDGASIYPGSQIKDVEVLNIVLDAALEAQIKYMKIIDEEEEKAKEELRQMLNRQAEEREKKSSSKKKKKDTSEEI